MIRGCYQSAARWCIAPAVLRNVSMIRRREGACRSFLSTFVTRPSSYNSLTLSKSQQASPASEAASFSVSRAAIAAELDSLIATAQLEGRGSLWLECEMHDGAIMSAASAAGFVFHRAEGKSAVLLLWLGKSACPIPPFATHNVGVAGLVVRPLDETVLVVKENNKNRSSEWKFPTGLANLGEDLHATASREVLEETGVRTSFRSLLAFRQQHNVIYGRSDLFFVCRLAALSDSITIDPHEIAACQWMKAADFIAASTHPLNKWALDIALKESRLEMEGKAEALPSSGSSMVVEKVFIPVTKRMVDVYRINNAPIIMSHSSSSIGTR